MDSCIFVVFGGTGDLMRRKLVSGFYALYKKKLLPKGFRIVGIGRRDYDSAFYRKFLTEVISDSEDLKEWPAFSKLIEYYQMDFQDAEEYGPLAQHLNQLDGENQCCGNKVFYLSTGPQHFSFIAQQLKKKGITDNGSKRVIIEKPFGSDLVSARKLNKDLQQVFKEDEIYRIDHYLAKETVQNILVFRFGNVMFEQVWNRNFVKDVQITAAESMGVGTRGGYYDHYGALRDMVQNHLMQMLSLVAMDVPESQDAIKEEKVKALQSIKLLRNEEVKDHVCKGQYENYLNEKGVEPGSKTETYVALKLHLNNWRWKDVPFYLRTGKMLKERATEIVINFKEHPKELFMKMPANSLVIRIQPNEGIHLAINIKKPGTSMQVEQVHMDFCHKSVFGENTPEAYERLLHDAMAGDNALFSRWDEVETSWKIIDPLLKNWRNIKLQKYEQGSWGPDAGFMKNNTWNIPTRGC